MRSVTNFEELQQAIADDVQNIVVESSILCYQTIVLPENSVLQGAEGKNVILFFNNGDGIGLTIGNTVKDLSIQTAVNHKAIFLNASKNNLGTFHFDNLTITGQFSFIARAGVIAANLILNNIDIVSADARNNFEQPQKYGVNVLQGALTIYNFNPDVHSKIIVRAENIRIGRMNAPVIGSGIFIGGSGDNGGSIVISRLHTHAVHSTGMLPFGVSDIITAAVFIVNGASAEEITHDGEIVTYGVNDMVLDAWGKVDTWTCNAPVISYGPSGVGFVNFGIVKEFVANAPLETHGLGARGYNQYDGTLDKASFHSITTYGDGSVGVQISKSIGKLTILGDIVTHGGIGNSLVKGVNVKLPAVALSIKPGGKVDQIDIKGNIITHGDKVISYEVNTGIVNEINVGGEIVAHGNDSKAIVVENGGITPIEQLKIRT